MRDYFGFVALCAVGLVGFGYFGVWSAAADSFAVLRVPMAIVAGVATILAWPRRLLRWLACFGFLAVMLPIFMPRLISATASDYDYVLYQQNLLFLRQDNEDWLEAVINRGPDFMTLQEVSGRNRVLMTRLAAELPSQLYCDFASVGGVAVLSHFSMVEGSDVCDEKNGLAAAQFDTPHGPVWLASIHLHWPWPYGQTAQVNRLVATLERLDGHVIIGGDFNQVRGSNTISRIEQASGTTLIGPHAPSFHVRGFPVGIDHILTSAAYAQEVRVAPKLGSDHNGVIAFLTRPIPP